MKLYLTPGACSLADHLALEEAGLAYETETVDLKSKQTASGADFRAINPKGYVPALSLDDGDVLTENLAILAWIADRGGGALTPPEGFDRYRLLEALAFISTEIHKGFKPFFNPAASDAEKDEARKNLAGRFALVERMMDGRPFLPGPGLSVADCYLFTMLFWTRGRGIDVPEALTAYYETLKARPAFMKVLADEGLGDKA